MARLVLKETQELMVLMGLMVKRVLQDQRVLKATRVLKEILDSTVILARTD